MTTAEHLKELFYGLFPTWPSIVATLLALVIVMFFLTKFLYQPIKKMVGERKKFIQENIDESIKHNNDAILDREKANHALIDARVAAAEIITKAKLRAEKIKEDNLVKAKDEANRIILTAQKDLEHEKLIFNNEAREEIITVALAAAKKIVEKEVDNKSNRKLVNKFIENGSKK